MCSDAQAIACGVDVNAEQLDLFANAFRVKQDPPASATELQGPRVIGQWTCR